MIDDPLLAMLACMFLAMGWWPCGCCPGECNCEGKAPDQWKVVLSGFSNTGGIGACTQCEQLNGTFFLDYFGECSWQADPPFSCAAFGGLFNISLFTDEDGVLTVTVFWSDSASNLVRFEKDYSPGKPDCINLVNESIPRVFNGAVDCVETSATCVVSAV